MGEISLRGSPSHVGLVLSVINLDDEVVKEVGGECLARANSDGKRFSGKRELLPEEGEPRESWN